MKKSEVTIPVSMMGESEVMLNRYRELVASGKCQPKMAEIIASRKAPASDTDTAHYAGHPSLYETAGPSYANKVHKEAARHGVKVTKDMHFNGSIADHRGGGDPAAWQMAGCGRDHFKKVIESRGEISHDLGVTDMDRSKEVLDRKQKAFDKRQSAKKERKEAATARMLKG